jgi:transposase
MRIIGCDLHARQQTVAMLDTDSGELVEKTLEHDGEELREFYSGLSRPVVVGIECRVGDPAKIRAAEPRKQKNDRRDAQFLLKLLSENRFPTIWMPSTEQRDLWTLLRHRHQWVRMRARVQHTLQSMALNHGLRRGHSLWNREGQDALRALPLAPHASERRKALMTLYPSLQESIDELDREVSQQTQNHPQARRLMTHPGVGPITALATEVFLEIRCGSPMGKQWPATWG